ncbi:MAG: division/cell wall cluster transcriptional repressor MraZ [archaeon GB-1867-035]|nr:division/cell wall cluster transcriptional repressor MraZ [Candidatus Culexmicrobium profundum]
MLTVSLDSRGRLTLPAEIRRHVKAKRFLVLLEGNCIKLIPLMDPKAVRGSIKIPWSIEELEEAGERLVLKRSQR